MSSEHEHSTNMTNDQIYDCIYKKPSIVTRPKWCLQPHPPSSYRSLMQQGQLARMTKLDPSAVFCTNMPFGKKFLFTPMNHCHSTPLYPGANAFSRQREKKMPLPHTCRCPIYFCQSWVRSSPGLVTKLLRWLMFLTWLWLLKMTMQYLMTMLIVKSLLILMTL